MARIEIVAARGDPPVSADRERPGQRIRVCSSGLEPDPQDDAASATACSDADESPRSGLPTG